MTEHGIRRMKSADLHAFAESWEPPTPYPAPATAAALRRELARRGNPPCPWESGKVRVDQALAERSR